MNPEWISGASYSWKVVGKAGVFDNVSGLCRRMAKDLLTRLVNTT